MPTIRNLTRQHLLLKRIGREIEPEASIHVTDDEAAQLAGHPLLAVDTPKSKSKTAKEGDGQ